MTTTGLLAALARECPNGVSFDPMAVRLLRQKVPLEDWQIEDLRAAMFQLGSGLWFSREMISDDESRLAFEDQAREWLMAHGCFSVERLFEDFRGVLRHINTPETCAAFLRHLGFKVAVWGKGGHFCFLPPSNLDDSLAEIAKTVAGWLEETDGTLPLNKIEQAVPHLTAEALESIRIHFLPDVHKTEVGGVPCWRSTESITLPEDFSEKLTTVVDTLVELKEKVTPTRIKFALNLFYRSHFCKEYALPNNDIFMRVCAKHYQGRHDAFPNSKKTRVRANGLSDQSKRVRSPNTRFGNLGVPIGAELILIKHSHISCIVLDDINQVKYEGKAWSISSLAKHLLGVSSENGFRHFSYDGDTLWNRRLRLEKAGKKDEYKAPTISPSFEVHGIEDEIIGLEGLKIAKSTWRAFIKDGTNPCVAEWLQRVEKGETLEQIALDSGYVVSTMRKMISNHRLYFKVCKLNGIVPEGGTNV